ncbi:hypothetical protein D3C86_2159080 [compost metagenome]
MLRLARVRPPGDHLLGEVAMQAGGVLMSARVTLTQQMRNIHPHRHLDALQYIQGK